MHTIDHGEWHTSRFALPDHPDLEKKSASEGFLEAEGYSTGIWGNPSLGKIQEKEEKRKKHWY